MLLAGGYAADGTQLIHSDSKSWDTEAVLIDLGVALMMFAVAAQLIVGAL